MVNENKNIISIKSNKINESELFIKYKSSYKSAFFDFSLHLILVYFSFNLVKLYKNTWLSIITVPLLCLLNLKTFIIFHDCGHNSYTPNKYLNTILSHILGVLVSTNPMWIPHHDVHHITNGIIKNDYGYKFNEIVYITVQKYQKFSEFNKLLYRFIYNPFVYFNLVPFIFFFLVQRYIYFYKHFFSNNKAKKNLNISSFYVIFTHLFNNIGMLLLYYALFKNGLMLYYFITLHITSALGFFLFFNQHTFNPSYVFDNNENWNYKDSGLKGSSLILVPYFLKYFTGGIEYHHIHHFNSKIPNYNLQSFHKEVISKSNIFDNIIKLSIYDCLNNLSLTLYDEKKNKYVTVKEADEEINKNKDI